MSYIYNEQFSVWHVGTLYTSPKPSQVKYDIYVAALYIGSISAALCSREERGLISGTAAGNRAYYHAYM